MVTDMKENGRMINLKGKEYFILIMAIYMMEILKMVKKKVKGFYIMLMGIDMKEIGRMINLKGKEYIIFIMEIGKWEII